MIQIILELQAVIIQDLSCLESKHLIPLGFKYFGRMTASSKTIGNHNYQRWLTEELEIDPDEITFIEDVWAGGGNLGPSVEYFVNGLELGNMVFMQYKTFPDGSREELPIKVIDVGIGLERVPWLINGTATSYQDVFRKSFVDINNIRNI